MLPADPATRADVERDIADINSVVDQFMDFARDEGAEIPEISDINHALETIVERATRSGVEISLTTGESIAAPIRRQAFKRLVNNLIDNAVKHAHSPILVVVDPRGRDGFCLSVLDRGAGIPPKEVARLKQPFTRLDSSRTGASGAGLGLAIVERIAKIHGATFDLIPRAGGGTEARVLFPPSDTIDNASD
jgi:two-component system osmolarity sensor histidine kinase EnvZ